MLCHYPRRSPQPSKKKSGIQDWHLMLFVLVLILIDVAFMCLHIILEGAIGNFNVAMARDEENPFTVEGVGSLNK